MTGVRNDPTRSRVMAFLAVLAGCSASVGEEVGQPSPMGQPPSVDSGAAPEGKKGAADDGGATPAGRDGSAARREVAYQPPFPPPACPAPAGTTTTDLGQYLSRLGDCHFAARAARLSALKTPAQVLDRRDYVRQRIVEEIGGFPEKTPLNVRKIPGDNGTPEFVGDGYRVEKIIFESQPHFYVTANLWKPPPSAPVPPTGFPAVLQAAGHCGAGKECYEDVTAALVRQGFVVLAFDPPGQAERCELDPGIGRNGWEHIVVGPPLILTGTSYARYEIWDAVRALDYLETRPEVDAKRIGITGSSGGGTQSFYLAAFDSRVMAAVPNSSMSSWQAFWRMRGMGDSEQVFTNFIRNGLDESDFALAMAAGPDEPARAFKFIQGVADGDFPIGKADGSVPGAYTTFNEGKRLFGILGQPDRFDFLARSGGHPGTPESLNVTVRWMQHWLLGAETQRILSLNLGNNFFNCTKSNSVYQDIPDAKTVQMMNAEMAKAQYAGRAASKAIAPDKLRALVAARIAVGGDRAATPEVKPNGAQTTRDGFSVEPILIQTEPGFSVRAALLLPSGASGPRPAVLYAGPTEEDPDAQELARAGYAVLTVEPRGTTEVVHVDPVQSDTSTSTAYTYSMKALMLGHPLVGMKVTDILRGFDYLKSRKEVDPGRIGLFGKQAAGVAVLHAAVLEPGIQKVAVEGALASYLDVTAVKMPFEILDLLVPGVLEDYDLPDLAAALSPRPVWIVSPRGAAGGALSTVEGQAVYGSGGARVLARAGSFAATYGEWLNR